MVMLPSFMLHQTADFFCQMASRAELVAQAGDHADGSFIKSAGFRRLRHAESTVYEFRSSFLSSNVSEQIVQNVHS